MRFQAGRTRCFLMLALAWLAGGVSSGRAPEWLQAHFGARPVSAEFPASLVLRTTEVRYLTEDRVRRVQRGILQVSAEHGRPLAVAQYGFNPDTERIVSAQAWVISPDRRRVEGFSTSEFSDTPLPLGRQQWSQHRVVAHSGAGQVRVGGMYAWEFQVESTVGVFDVHFDFAFALPVEIAWFEVIPPPGGRLDWHAPSRHLAPPVAGLAGALRWTQSTPGPSKAERPQGFLPEPLLVLARAVPAGATSGPSWNDFARLAAGLIEPRLVPTPEVQSRAAAIVGSRTERWEKIRELASWVQREISYLAVSLDRDYLAGYRPHAAGDVLRNRFGDCKDKAALLIALLRAVGEEAFPVLIAAGNPGQVRKEWPAAAFNHLIVAFPARGEVPAHWPVVDDGALGRLVLFDPTDRHTPLGFLPGADRTGFGLVASPQVTGPVPLPASRAEWNQYRSTVNASLDETGNLVVQVAEELRGSPAVAWQAWRSQIAPEQMRRALEARVREGMASVRNLKSEETWEAETATARMQTSFLAERHARRAGSLLIVNPQVLPRTFRLPAWQTEQAGLAWAEAATMEREMRLVLPAALEVEELPEDFTLESPTAAGKVTCRRDGRDVVLRYELRQAGGLLAREHYEEMRAGLQKLQEAERRPIVLIRK